MSENRKIHPEAVLKLLPAEKQEAIISYLDGDSECGVKGHSYVKASAWLRADGITASPSSLRNFWSWWHLQQRLDQNAAATEAVVSRGREEGWIKTAEEAQLAGQSFFTQLAIAQQDNLGFVRILREQTRKQIAKTDREKFEFDASRACLKAAAAIKTVSADNTLDESGKIDKVRQLLFGELAE